MQRTSEFHFGQEKYYIPEIWGSTIWDKFPNNPVIFFMNTSKLLQRIYIVVVNIETYWQ